MSVLSPTVIETFIHIRIANCTAVAAVTVLIWDYLITLPDEVALIWPSSWNISKSLFLLNRYLAFVDPIMLIQVLIFDDDAKLCIYHFRILAWFCIAGFVVGQFILILRAYAVWGAQYNRLFAVIMGLTLVIFAVSFWTSAKYINGVYSIGVLAQGVTGCAPIFRNRLAWIDFVLFLAVESTSTGLMVIKAIQHFRVSRHSLMTTIYNDGLLYFGLVLAMAIANVIVFVVAPRDMNGFLIIVQRVLHSLLCSRVLLHIRSAYEAQNRRLIGDSLPTMVIAQMAEPLNDSLWPSDHSGPQYDGSDYRTFDDGNRVH
ncbi:hypothetical protein BD410DRAFT_632978 [Rickenella mellea]|uniref:DUF6533 domain-containing protein n=1 Tax=Rickenella mellea TaxID=50990 RepID=A0A4Y7QEE4_9AGAM|nr:hypothetical protein BD410DRAFT_632978 [Rickenella mellea]